MNCSHWQSELTKGLSIDDIPHVDESWCSVYVVFPFSLYNVFSCERTHEIKHCYSNQYER